MTNSIRSTKRGFALSLIATALTFAAIGCGGEVQSGDGTVGSELATCPKADPWTIGRAYKVGELVSFKSGVFSCRQAHTPVDGWFPNIVPALWTPLQCTTGTAATPPAPTPTPTPTPTTGNTGGGGGTGGGNTGQCVGGPAFDPAGAKNVGNGQGLQFIGGQCLRTADCASDCCAFPCGICSGKGAQFQAGKQGCGFGG